MKLGLKLSPAFALGPLALFLSKVLDRSALTHAESIHRLDVSGHRDANTKAADLRVALRGPAKSYGTDLEADKTLDTDYAAGDKSARGKDRHAASALRSWPDRSAEPPQQNAVLPEEMAAATPGLQQQAHDGFRRVPVFNTRPETLRPLAFAM